MAACIGLVVVAMILRIGQSRVASVLVSIGVVVHVACGRGHRGLGRRTAAADAEADAG